MSEHGRVPVKLGCPKMQQPDLAASRSVPTPGLDGVVGLVYIFLHLIVFHSNVCMGLFYNVGTYIKWVEVNLCYTEVLFKKKNKPNRRYLFPAEDLE